MKEDGCGRNEYEGETRTEYSILKEVLKFHECGWSDLYIASKKGNI
jgi:hypothetical protein